MDWALSVFNIKLDIGFYEGIHGYLYFKSNELKKEGRISVRVLNMNEENAITLNSLFFRNNVVFLSDKMNEKSRHEEGHIKLFNYIYTFMIFIVAVLPLSKIIIIPAVLVGKFLLWKMERDVDLYAYSKNESNGERPKRRLDRIKAWIFKRHSPNYNRKNEV